MASATRALSRWMRSTSCSATACRPPRTSTRTRGDAVLAVSASGRTTDTLVAVEIARESGAQVVAIAPGGSPLAKLATVALCADVPEDPDIYAPMVSRLAHLAIIDVLSVGLALALGPSLPKRLERSKQTLRDKRLRAPNVG